MLFLIIFFATCYGITNIAVFGSIFNGWRVFWDKHNPSFLGKLFSCPLCLSTWVGFIVSYYLGNNDLTTPWLYYGVQNEYVRIFLDGCAVSGVVWVIHTVQEAFERAFVK